MITNIIIVLWMSFRRKCLPQVCLIVLNFSAASLFGRNGSASSWREGISDLLTRKKALLRSWLAAVGKHEELFGSLPTLGLKKARNLPETLLRSRAFSQVLASHVRWYGRIYLELRVTCLT